MFRRSRTCMLGLFTICLFVANVTLGAQTVPILPLPPVDNPPSTDPPAAIARNIHVSFQSPAANFLFLAGEPVQITASILNTAASQDSTVTITVMSGLGAQVLKRTFYDPLMEGETLEYPITLGEDYRLPGGPYIMEVLVKAEKDWGYGEASFGVWNGPLSVQSDFLGINYTGPLQEERAMRELQLFQDAGIGWLRLPVQGWMPQGQAIPIESLLYDRLLRSAAEKNIQVLAAFTPQISVDPTINSLQAQKDYNESLLAAAARYGFMVKRWELLTISRPLYPSGLQGIWYTEIKPGREALTRFDKSLQVFYGADDPALANVEALLRMDLPLKGDGIALHYNMQSLPEMQKERTPSTLVGEASSKAKYIIKRVPPVWITDFGFHPRLLRDSGQTNTHQAALFARTALLSRFTNIERIFWRHNTTDTNDLPFSSEHGGVQPTYLALRTIVSQINGLSAVTPVFTSLIGQDNTNIHLMRFDEQQGKKKKISRYKLVLWTTRISHRTTLALRTVAPRIMVTDIWGNVQVLQPSNNIALVQADEFPRFIDLDFDGKVEVSHAGAVAFFTPNCKWLTADGDHNIKFTLVNNQNIFQGRIAGRLVFHSWPGGQQQAPVDYELEPYREKPIEFRDLFNDRAVMQDARNQRLFSEINVDIMHGELRMGYLTLPVYYSSAQQ